MPPRSRAVELRRNLTRTSLALIAVHGLLVDLVEEERNADADHAAAVAELRAAHAQLECARWAIYHALRAVERGEG